MENGITGMFRDPFFKNAMTTHMKKIANLATLSSAQEEALIAIHELGKSSMTGFSDKAKAMLKNAGFKDDQIEKILKAKSNQENGIKTAVEEVKPAPAKVATANPAPIPAKPAVAAPPAPSTVVQAVDSPGRRAVLANYSRDEIYNYKFLEIPDGLTGEALATKQRAKAAHAKDALAKIFKGEKNIEIQETIYSNGETVSKSKRFIAEYEEKLAKLPAKGADMTKKDLQDKLDRAKTSLEIAQKRCRTIVDLYKVGYGIEQYIRQYEKDFDNYCK
jgi:Mg2+ and Co2+ transporter CorA